jgi:hypothetical protein
MGEHFRQRRKELSWTGADVATLAKQLGAIEKRWKKSKQAFDADAISQADLKWHRERLDAECEAVAQELPRVKNCDSVLLRLSEEEAEMRERIEAAENNLKDTISQQRRQLYQNLSLRVEVGEDMHPYISGVSPVRVAELADMLVRTPDQRGFLTTQEPLPLAELRYASKRVTSSRHVFNLLTRSSTGPSLSGFVSGWATKPPT